MLRKKVRTRIAPSPTGPFHIGTARTALFNFLFARQNKGKFILRIEDTDRERSDPRFEKDILNGLEWLNLKWDEGPFRQSENLSVYKKYLEKLLDEKKAFWCFHGQKELAREREEQMKSKKTVSHFCSYRNLGKKPKENESGIIRFKNDVKENDIKFKDLIRGEVKFKGEILGDFSIAKNLNSPLYNFAVVIDDDLMKITHVIRGEDHISNTPKQILIQKALGIKPPIYAHLPLILGKDRSKLSKRNAVISVNEYRHQGYLPESLINFMALLGWRSPDDEKEIFSLRELIKEFSLKKTQKGGAVFNIDKLNWINEHYIKKMPSEELQKRLLLFIPEKWRERAEENYAYWRKIIGLEAPRLKRLIDIKEGIEYFFEKPQYSKDLLLWRDQKQFSEVFKHLRYIRDEIQNEDSPNFSAEDLKNKFMPYAEENGKGNVLWPFRAALTGKRYSPDPFEVAGVLGREKTLERLNWAIELIRNS